MKNKVISIRLPEDILNILDNEAKDLDVKRGPLLAKVLSDHALKKDQIIPEKAEQPANVDVYIPRDVREKIKAMIYHDVDEFMKYGKASPMLQRLMRNPEDEL